MRGQGVLLTSYDADMAQIVSDPRLPGSPVESGKTFGAVARIFCALTASFFLAATAREIESCSPNAEFAAITVCHIARCPLRGNYRYAGVHRAPLRVGAQMKERRRWIRFPLELAARLKHGRSASEGVTVNLSGGGALIRSATELSPGASVEAHFQWPVSLEECKLKLVMTGSVVWTKGLLTAISAKRYEFRTVGKNLTGHSAPLLPWSSE